MENDFASKKSVYTASTDKRASLLRCCPEPQITKRPQQLTEREKCDSSWTDRPISATLCAHLAAILLRTGAHLRSLLTRTPTRLEQPINRILFFVRNISLEDIFHRDLNSLVFVTFKDTISKLSSSIQRSFLKTSFEGRLQCLIEQRIDGCER